MLMIDEENNHVMKSSLSEFGSVFLIWPKNLTVKWLEFAREATCFQLDTMIAGAKRRTERQEAADAEYNSWFESTAEIGRNKDGGWV